MQHDASDDDDEQHRANTHTHTDADQARFGGIVLWSHQDLPVVVMILVLVAAVIVVLAHHRRRELDALIEGSVGMVADRALVVGDVVVVGVLRETTPEDPVPRGELVGIEAAHAQGVAGGEVLVDARRADRRGGREWAADALAALVAPPIGAGRAASSAKRVQSIW